MSTNIEPEARTRSLAVVEDQLRAATAAKKCHGCGCLHSTVEALAGAEVGSEALGPVLADARRVFAPKAYDCLGCPVCYPAIAANAFAEAFPGVGEGLDLCPTDAPVERRGWPPLPGDYRVIRFRAPVAICTLNSTGLTAAIAEASPAGVAIVGTLHTENLGIERIIRNVLANPNVRFLILCGEDTEQAVGHLPGQSLVSLSDNGLDDRGRIVGARGKRPVLKNVSPEEVEAFREQVEVLALIGEASPEVVLERAAALAARDPGPVAGAPAGGGLETVNAAEPRRLIPDPAGFLVVYPDAPRRRLVVEHYTTGGVLDAVLEGATPAALYAAVIDRALVSRLDHAAYLGRELARAERSLQSGEPYVQDRAAGELAPEPAPKPEASSCGCGGACNTEVTP